MEPARRLSICSTAEHARVPSRQQSLQMGNLLACNRLTAVLRSDVLAAEAPLLRRLTC